MEVMNKIGDSLWGRLHAPGLGCGPVIPLSAVSMVSVPGPRRIIQTLTSQAKYHFVGGLFYIIQKESLDKRTDIKLMVLPPEKVSGWFLVGEFLDLQRPAYFQVWRPGVIPDDECPIL